MPPVAQKPFSRAVIGTNVTVQVLLGLALFGLINYLSYRHYARLDLSPDKDFTLSDATLNYMRKLGKDVEITVVFARDSAVMSTVRTMVEEYRRVKRSRVKTEEIDPARDVERAESLKVEHGIALHGNGILVRANRRTRFITEEEIVVRGLNGDRQNPSVDFRGEDALTSAIVGLIEGGERKFYFIVGKGATAQAGSELAYLALAALGKQQNFSVMPLNLTDLEKIPEDANGVLLIGAKYDLSEREGALLREYWERKRAALLVLLDPSGETPRLQEFLSEQGVVPRADRVLYAESTSAGPKKQFSVQTTFLKDSLISQPFAETASSFSGQTQSLNLKTDSAALRSQHISVTPLIDAAERFWGESRFEAELPTIDKQDTKPPVHLAASVERGAVSDERLRVDSTRMVVVGNATMLDPSTRLGVHQDFIAACLNWMLSRERLIGVTAKRQRSFRMQITEEEQRKFFWVTAFLMLSSVLAFGFLVWNHRRA
ncbi:MAG: DUF7088 domain-containing protein [Verrucomicrobiaceae bacterium]